MQKLLCPTSQMCAKHQRRGSLIPSLLPSSTRGGFILMNVLNARPGVKPSCTAEIRLLLTSTSTAPWAGEGGPQSPRQPQHLHSSWEGAGGVCSR